MGNPGAKRRRPEGEGHRKPAKKIRNFKKQKNYHSSSESEDDVDAPIQDRLARFNPIDVNDSDDDPAKPKKTENKQKREKKERKKPTAAAAAAAAAAADVSAVPAAPAVSASVSKATLKSALKPAPKKAAAVEPESETGDDEDDEEEEDEDDDDDDDDVVENLDDLEDLDEDDEPDLIDADEFDDSDAASDDSTSKTTKKRKRNDPTAFATSMSKILSSKLSNAKRSDPVLSRSVDAATASKELIDQRLEAKAKRQLHAEKRQAMEKGRVKDVLGLDTTSVSTAHIQEQERRLKKTAQRGVVKLFNAVRAAQVKGEQARAEAKREGVVGMGQREERASEMSKKGFLDLLAQGGKKTPATNPQEV